VNLAPDVARYHLLLGKVHFAAGRVLEAVAELRAALERGSEEIDVGSALAAALWKLGERTQARRWMARVYRENAEVRDILGGDAREMLLLLEEAVHIPGNENLLPEVEKTRKALRPDLASFSSIDAALDALDAQDLVSEHVQAGTTGGPAVDGEAFRSFPFDFALDDPGSFRQLELEAWSDRGAIVLLDGREIGREGEAVRGALYPLALSIDPKTLAPGKHTIAVRAAADPKTGEVLLDVH
jgi:tetratricopeptide (TPR) repeat protein